MIRRFDSESLDRIKEYCTEDDIGNKISSFFSFLDIFGILKKNRSDNLELNIDDYVDNIDEYHKKLVQADKISSDSLEEIFDNVKGVDARFGGMYHHIDSLLNEYANSLERLTSIITDSNGGSGIFLSESSFADSLKSGFDGAYGYIKKRYINEDGKYNYTSIRETLSKDKDELDEMDCYALALVLNELADPMSVDKTMENVDSFLEEVFLNGDVNSDAWYIVSQKFNTDTSNTLLNASGISSKDNALIEYRSKAFINDVIKVTGKKIDYLNEYENNYNDSGKFSFSNVNLDVGIDNKLQQASCNFGDDNVEISMLYPNLKSQMDHYLNENVNKLYVDVIDEHFLTIASSLGSDTCQEVTGKITGDIAKDFADKAGTNISKEVAGKIAGDIAGSVVSVAWTTVEIYTDNEKDKENNKILDNVVTASDFSTKVDKLAIGGTVIKEGDSIDISNLYCDKNELEERIRDFNNKSNNYMYTDTDADKLFNSFKEYVLTGKRDLNYRTLDNFCSASGNDNY